MSRRAVEEIVKERANWDRRLGKEPKVDQIRKEVIRTALRVDRREGERNDREK